MRIPYEELALRDAPLPKEARGAEINAYLAMRILYREYRRGDIKREQAKHEKEIVVDRYKSDLRNDEIIVHIAELRKRIEPFARNYAKNPTLENADRFYAAVYDLPPDWRKTPVGGGTG